MQFDNPYAWLLLLSTLVSVGVSAFVWRRRKAPGGRATLLLLAGVTVWTLGYGLQLFHTQVFAMLFFTKVVYLGVVTVGASWLIFAIAYTGRTDWLTRRNLLLLMIEPAIILLMVWTSDFHTLVYSSLAVVENDGFVYLTSGGRGPMFWVHTVYSYLTLSAGTFLVIRAMVRSPQLYRDQMIALLIAAAAPWVGNVIHLTIHFPVDPTPLAFLITGLSMALGCFRYRLFNVIPIARDLVMERIEEAVLVLDDLGRIVDANLAARQLFTLEGPGWIGKPCQSVFGERWASVGAIFEKEPPSGEINLGKPGSPHWYELHVSDIHHNRQELVAGRLLVFHDVQARKQAEEMMAEARDQALQASLLKSQLIANVSHDLRTPLNAILGFSEMLAEGTFEKLAPKQADAVKNIFNSAQQVNLLINDLLDQALIEKGKLMLYPAAFHPAELAAGVRSVLGGAAQQKGLDLNIHIENRLPETLIGDVKRLQQIINNLVSNAIRFTDRGYVRVGLYKIDECNWAIEVTDTGRGVAADVKELIFEPFAHFDHSSLSDGTAGRKQSGAGLGLAIVKHLTTMMGGHVTVDSVLNRGSTFRVVLPLLEAQTDEKSWLTERTAFNGHPGFERKEAV